MLKKVGNEVMNYGFIWTYFITLFNALVTWVRYREMLMGSTLYIVV